ncbi:extensin [Iris pallida]|uniref:Extensin n=1 Tax=Iris pallida TaxID=29817 RepID=A0AAX6DQ05_IRIPA|nr:extensin [Iris pallida]
MQPKRIPNPLLPPSLFLPVKPSRCHLFGVATDHHPSSIRLANHIVVPPQHQNPSTAAVFHSQDHHHPLPLSPPISQIISANFQSNTTRHQHHSYLQIRVPVSVSWSTSNSFISCLVQYNHP